MHRAGTVAATSLLVLIAGASFAAVDGAAAPACSATVTISGPNNGNLILTPGAPKVAIGDCLSFTNSTSSLVSIKITKAGASVYSTSLPRGGTTTTAGSYAPKNAGRGTISATSRILLIGKAAGSAVVTVSTAPTHSPSPSDSPTPKGHQSSKPSSKPSKSANPHKSSKSHSPKPHATGFKLPPLPPLPSVGQSALPKGSSPVVAPGLPTLAPVTSASSTPVAAVVAGPLETAEDASRGLPIAVAVLVILGLASGYGRVLLATPRPVDKRSDGDHRV